LNDCTDRQNQTSNRCLKLTARWLSHLQYIKYTKMYLLSRMYGPHTTKCFVYASIVTALHEIIDLKHRSPWIRLYPLLIECLLYEFPFNEIIKNVPYAIASRFIWKRGKVVVNSWPRETTMTLGFCYLCWYLWHVTTLNRLFGSETKLCYIFFFKTHRLYFALLANESIWWTCGGFFPVVYLAMHQSL